MSGVCFFCISVSEKGVSESFGTLIEHAKQLFGFGGRGGVDGILRHQHTLIVVYEKLDLSSKQDKKLLAEMEAEDRAE